MSQITHINADEMLCLQGLSLEAKTIYVFELRRYADENGVTGLVRRHSYRSFREQLTVIPDPKSTRKPAEITEGKIRAILAELERHGLIEKRPEPLVFQLVLAARPQSVQNMNDGRTTARATARTTDESLRAATVSGTRTTDRTTDSYADEQRTSPITIKTPLPPLGEDEIPSGWKADSRTMKPMSLDWTPDPNTLNTYLQGKAANGRPVTAADISARLDSWRENANASGKVMTDAQWTLRLIKYVTTCMASDGLPANHWQPANQSDPLAFTEENRPKHGPYALLKPEPKKTPLDEEGRKRIEALKQQLFGPRTAA